MSKRENVNPETFIIDKEKDEASKNKWQMPLKTTGFTTNGIAINVKAFECYCMVDIQKTSTRFWVKMNLQGYAFNPWGFDNEKEYIQTMGKFKWQFKQITEAGFRNYLKFLTTGNQSYLRIAQRDIS